MPDAAGHFRGISVPKALPTTDDLQRKMTLLVRQERRAAERLETAKAFHAQVQHNIHELQEQINARRR